MEYKRKVNFVVANRSMPKLLIERIKRTRKKYFELQSSAFSTPTLMFSYQKTDSNYLGYVKKKEEKKLTKKKPQKPE